MGAAKTFAGLMSGRQKRDLENTLGTTLMDSTIVDNEDTSGSIGQLIVMPTDSCARGAALYASLNRNLIMQQRNETQSPSKTQDDTKLSEWESLALTIRRSVACEYV